MEAADVDADLIDYLLTLTPAERIRRQLEAVELVRALRQAREKQLRTRADPPSPAR
jgi:hypothetical protein